MYGLVGSVVESADDLPCADFGLLGPLKRSPEYDRVRKRVADPKPIDAWRIADENYFVFELKAPADDATASSFALFKMLWDYDSPRLAVIVTKRPDAKEVEVSAVEQPDRVQKVPLK
jgi:hypothetical protein